MSEIISALQPPTECKDAKKRLNNGDILGCLDTLQSLSEEEQEFWKNRFLKARALTQSGQSKQSRKILNDLLKDPLVQGSPENKLEIYCAIGRTWKDEWQHANNPKDAAECLTNSIQSYEDALEANPGSYYASINLATLSLLAKNIEYAQDVARRTLEYCEAQKDDVWSIGSRAEAHAVLGNIEQALKDYTLYANEQKGELRSLCTTRKQARWIAEATGNERHIFDDAFKLPSIVVFSGHRMDSEDRVTPRLPASALPAVLEAIRTQLKKINAGIGFSSAADGSDILFLQAMRDLGGETHITLSSPEENFIEENVKNTAEVNWRDQYHAAISYARSHQASGRGSVSIASPHAPSLDSIAYTYASKIMSGDAYQRSKHLDLDIYPLAVWNGKAGDGQGGTHDFVNNWWNRAGMARVHQVITINPEELDWEGKPNFSEVRAKRSLQLESDEIDRFPQEIKGILFADVKHFSKLTEQQVVQYCRHYLGEVSSIISAEQGKRDSHGPLISNTWGDAFYMVFENVRDAGLFALGLQNSLVPPPLGKANWEQHNLPPELSIRIALHAGPVFRFSDPVIRAMSFTGRHVSFAARLEPSTPPGEIYASQAFAAYAAMDNVKDFNCEYVGIVPGAKKFGDIKAYRLTSKNLQIQC